MERQVRFFTTSEGARIAYVTIGQGLPLVLVPPWLSHLGLVWEVPAFRSFYEELARDFTVVIYDRYGCGLSDRDRSDFSCDVDCRVLAEVVDHLRLRRFAIFGPSQGGLVAVPYAVSHPRRVSQLLLYGTWRRSRASELESAVRALILAHWGIGAKTAADWFLPGSEPAAVEWFASLQREAATAETAVALMEGSLHVDLTDLLSHVAVPTLVMHRRGDRAVPFESARDLAARIPGARLAALEGESHIAEFGDPDGVIRAIREFVGAPDRRGRETERAASEPLGLSGREVEVLRLIAGGLSNPEIAARLHLSVHTIERHAVNIYTKIGARGRSEATAYALRHGLEPLSGTTRAT
jgi:pimeloyl-ACP methyl ester carboxylesterase/DNA-binding CsgD family transcriptional regulator